MSVFIYLSGFKSFAPLERLCDFAKFRCGRKKWWLLQVIYRSRWLKWSVQVNFLLNNCKQNITSLSLFVGTTVADVFDQYYCISLKRLEKRLGMYNICIVLYYL